MEFYKCKIMDGVLFVPQPYLDQQLMKRNFFFTFMASLFHAMWLIRNEVLFEGKTNI